MTSRVGESGLEVIAVIIGGKVCGTYEGLAGTFAGFTDCCLRKKALPGFYQEGLIVEAELKGRSLRLVLPVNRPPAELTEILDIALLNMVAFPYKGGEAECFIEVKSEKEI